MEIGWSKWLQKTTKAKKNQISSCSLRINIVQIGWAAQDIQW